MPAPPSSLPLAERGTRLLAASIDELILLAIALPMLLPGLVTLTRATASMMAGDTDAEVFDTTEVIRAMSSGTGAILTTIALLCWCAVTVWLVAANGQSIGKRLTGIKVVRVDGSPASFARIFLLRNVVNSLPMVIPTIGLVYQLLDPLLIYQNSRRCLHDMIADTVVVRCDTGRHTGVS